MIQSTISRVGYSLLAVLVCHAGASQELTQPREPSEQSESTADLESVTKLIESLGEPHKHYRNNWLGVWYRLLLDRAKIDRDHANTPDHRSQVNEFLTSPQYREAWKVAWHRAYEGTYPELGDGNSVMVFWGSVHSGMFGTWPSTEWINTHLRKSQDEVRQTIDQLLESEAFAEHWRVYIQPRFTARLLVLKADWSKLDNAAELEAELRAVLAEESLDSPAFDAGQATVLQVLFPREMAVSYSAQKMASLTSWLEKHGLLQDSIEFALPIRTMFAWTPERPKQITFVTTHELEADRLGSPSLAASDPYTKQRNVLRWTIRCIESSDEFRVWSGFHPQQLMRGHTAWQDSGGFDDYCAYDVPDSDISIIHATRMFGGGPVVPLLLIDRTPGGQPNDAKPALVLPDRVSRLTLMEALPPGNRSKTTDATDLDASASQIMQVARRFQPEEAGVDNVANFDLATLRAKNDAAEQSAQELAKKKRELASTSTDAANQLTAELRAAVAEAFAIRQRLQRVELAAFEERLKQLHNSLDGRDKLADEIIDRRVADLLNPQRRWNIEEPVDHGLSGDDTVDRALLEEQIDVLQRRLASVKALFARGKTALAELLQAHVALYDAQLRFALTIDAKREANQNALAALDELRELIDVQVKGGIASSADLLAVEATLLECKRKATQAVPRTADKQ